MVDYKYVRKIFVCIMYLLYYMINIKFIYGFGRNLLYVLVGIYYVDRISLVICINENIKL